MNIMYIIMKCIHLLQIMCYHEAVPAQGSFENALSSCLIHTLFSNLTDS